MGNYNRNEKKAVSRRIEKYFFIGVVSGGVIGMLGFLIFDSIFFILFAFIFGIFGVLYATYLDKKEEIEKNKKMFRN